MTCGHTAGLRVYEVLVLKASYFLVSLLGKNLRRLAKMTYDPQSRTNQVIIVNAVLFFLSTGMVSIRLVSRRLSAARFWLDDGFAIAAWVCITTTTAKTMN